MAKNTFRDDEELKKSVNFNIFKRLLRYFGPHRVEVIKTLLCMSVVVLCTLLNPIFMKQAIDVYIADKDVRGLLLDIDNVEGYKQDTADDKARAVQPYTKAYVLVL